MRKLLCCIMGIVLLILPVVGCKKESNDGFLRGVTDGKYSSLGVDSELKLSFLTENGDSRSVDYLSGGTREIAYVAVRMALIDMLYAEKPPICFDETFACQDNARATSMMKAISRLSEEGNQSFIFTCRQREANLASELQSGTAVFKLSVASDA